jgi:hypothetical protein
MATIRVANADPTITLAEVYLVDATLTQPHTDTVPDNNKNGTLTVWHEANPDWFGIGSNGRRKRLKSSSARAQDILRLHLGDEQINRQTHSTTKYVDKDTLYESYQ